MSKIPATHSLMSKVATTKTISIEEFGCLGMKN